jgi:hypothetical protein
MALRVLWFPDNCSLSTIEYIDSWISVSKYVDVLKPAYLLIDAYEFEYRAMPEVSAIFNDISHKIKSENIALVTSNNVLGKNTLDNLIRNSPLKGHNVFNSSNEGKIWFESLEPLGL